MDYIIVSDVHANLEALNAVIKDIEQNYDLNSPDTRVVNLGDVIGYGPNPIECIARINEISDINLPGNHELSILDIIDGRNDRHKTNSDYLPIFEWTANEVKDSNEALSWLEGVANRNPIYGENNLIFVHSEPYTPYEMHYIKDMNSAKKHFFDNFKNRICFVGHSHILQAYYKFHTGEVEGGQIQRTEFSEGIVRRVYTRNLSGYESALIVVPGLGQPRDWNFTGYAVYDDQTKELSIIRLSYGFGKTQMELSKLRSEVNPELLRRLASALAMQ